MYIMMFSIVTNKQQASKTFIYDNDRLKQHILFFFLQVVANMFATGKLEF